MWADEILQPIAQSQPTYFPKSFALNRMLMDIKVPPTALLFTYDAITMYPSIPTGECIQRLEKWFTHRDQARWFTNVRFQDLMEAIRIVIKNNRMKFGDIFAKQIKGIAMGMSPSPPIANIFIAIYENEKVLGKFDDCILSSNFPKTFSCS